MQSENTAETMEATEEPGGDAVGIQNLGELLLETEPEDQEESPGTEQPAEIEKFNDLAGTLGMELDDLYKLTVTASEDGEPVTIESLKDLYSKQGEIEMRSIEFEERRTEEEQKLLQAQTELRDLIATLPKGAVKAEVLEKIRAKHQQTATEEQQRTLEIIPSWQDAKTRETEITAMTKHLAAYGFPVNYLANVVDHRQIKYIRDNWQREQRMKAALASVKAGKPKPTTRQKPSTKAPTKRPVTGVKKGSYRNKLEAVFSDID